MLACSIQGAGGPVPLLEAECPRGPPSLLASSRVCVCLCVCVCVATGPPSLLASTRECECVCVRVCVCVCVCDQHTYRAYREEPHFGRRRETCEV